MKQERGASAALHWSEGRRAGTHRVHPIANWMFSFVVYIGTRRPSQARPWARVTLHVSKGQWGGANVNHASNSKATRRKSRATPQTFELRIAKTPEHER